MARQVCGSGVSVVDVVEERDGWGRNGTYVDEVLVVVFAFLGNRPLWSVNWRGVQL